MIRPSAKEQLHVRNRFRTGYDFARLVASSPRLAVFVAPNLYGDTSIDYANPEAVKALNQALLKHAYGIDWDLPPGYLCPPIPGRSDYLHYLADLLEIGAAPARRRTPVVLDIGMGANCIYPLIGAREYGWRFVGTEIDPVALRWAKQLVAANPAVAKLIECRLQKSPLACFSGVTKAGETFDLSMCNPPFHASAEAAAAGTRRKRRNLGQKKSTAPVLNFGGHAGELWCEGGELGFVRRLIAESAERPQLCRWFTTLVSTRTHLAPLFHSLQGVKAVDVRTLEMAHGQKTSCILAWTFSVTIPSEVVRRAAKERQSKPGSGRAYPQPRPTLIRRRSLQTGNGF
jgi:23S rRNA (adenine1618-N6)-methyltransferase